jgi:hypothetical protein
MNWKGYGKKRSCLKLRYHSGFCLEVPRKTTKKIVRIACLRAEIWTVTSRIRSRNSYLPAVKFGNYWRKLTRWSTKYTWKNYKRNRDIMDKLKMNQHWPVFSIAEINRLFMSIDCKETGSHYSWRSIIWSKTSRMEVEEPIGQGAVEWINQQSFLDNFMACIHVT